MAATVDYSGAPPLGFDISRLMAPEALAAARARVIVEPIAGVDSRFACFGARALVLRNVLSSEECQFIIGALRETHLMEDTGYTADYRRCHRVVVTSAELATTLYERIRPVVENRIAGLRVGPASYKQQRCLLPTDAGEAVLGDTQDAPYELQLGYGLEGDWIPVGLNDHFRCCRYDAGGFFRVHCDAQYIRNSEERSLYTCQFYLDGGFPDGRTRFVDLGYDLPTHLHKTCVSDEDVVGEVVPEPGLCLLFFQRGLLHEGEDVSATKHILRSDLMFRRVEGSQPQVSDEQRRAAKMLVEAQTAEEAGELQKALDLYMKAYKLDPELEKLHL